MKNKIGLFIVLIIAVLQLFVADKIPFREVDENDFLEIESPTKEVAVILKNVCYDCHSNQIKYPWYYEIAAISWWLSDHIEEGREHLNFSEWGIYKRPKKAHKAEECVEEVEEEEMPLPSYTYLHKEADLSDEQRSLLEKYFKGIEKKYQ